MSQTKAVAIGGRNHLDLTGASTATEGEPAFAVPSQQRVDKQVHGLVTKDLSADYSSASSAVWTVTDAEANAKVLRPLNVSSAVAAAGSYEVNVPANGMWFVDNGQSGSSQSVAVVTSSSASGVTIAAKQVAGVITNGGTVRRLTADTSAT